MTTTNSAAPTANATPFRPLSPIDEDASGTTFFAYVAHAAEAVLASL